MLTKQFIILIPSNLNFTKTKFGSFFTLYSSQSHWMKSQNCFRQNIRQLLGNILIRITTPTPKLCAGNNLIRSLVQWCNGASNFSVERIPWRCYQTFPGFVVAIHFCLHKNNNSWGLGHYKNIFNSTFVPNLSFSPAEVPSRRRNVIVGTLPAVIRAHTSHCHQNSEIKVARNATVHRLDWNYRITITL